MLLAPIRTTADVPDIFCLVLVDCQIYCAEGAPPYFLLDYILIDPMLGDAIVVTCNILGSCIERLLDTESVP